MIDFIGVLFWTTVYFCFSALVGVAFALVAWLLLRKRSRWHRRVLLAAVLPVACAVYMEICFVLSPGRSVFGDIDEPLPNGYTLKALGKMPDYGNIESVSAQRQLALTGWIGSVDLEGDRVYGIYSHTFDAERAPSRCCFMLDTRAGTVVDFVTPDQMNNAAGRQLHLVEVQFFRSHEPERVRLMRIEGWITFLPPGLAALCFLGLLLRWRLDPKAPPG